MASGMLQDPIQSPPSGTRPRPFASSKHQVIKARYITSNDPRGYIPVYEYPLNNQWIMMDIDDGYILWTGIWKALGNSKADIVKMIDSQPDLAPLIRRVRGGYLKIQGTWMPYEVALRLSRRVAWTIRDDLVPLFGPTFPSTCLSPDQPGYGQVVTTGNNRRRTRRNTQAVASTTQAQAPRESGNPNWTVVTPPGANTPSLSNPTIPSPGPAYSARLDHRHQMPPPTSGPSAPSLAQEYGGSHRYSPYFSVATPRRASRGSLSHEIPALMPDAENITLPPLRTVPNDQGTHNPHYALPPISAMEDLRGLHSTDSAAVLRRLKEDDGSYVPGRYQSCSSSQNDNGKAWTRRHSLAAQPYLRSVETSPKRQNPSSLPAYSHAHGSHPYYDYASRQLGRISRPHSRSCSLSRQSHEGDISTSASTCEPSPVSPSTPHSILSSPRSNHRYREENSNNILPLTIAANRIHLEPTSEEERASEYSSHRRYSVAGVEEDSSTKYSDYQADHPVRHQPLRPW